MTAEAFPHDEHFQRKALLRGIWRFNSPYSLINPDALPDCDLNVEYGVPPRPSIHLLHIADSPGLAHMAVDPRYDLSVPRVMYLERARTS